MRPNSRIFDRLEQTERKTLAFVKSGEKNNLDSSTKKMIATVTHELEINDDEAQKYKSRALSLLRKYGSPNRIPGEELVSEKATIYLDDAKLLAYCLVLEEIQKLK